jgi:hypothetical protein
MTALLLAEAPALPLDEAGKYVAGAYIVFVLLLLVYVALMATKLARIERELREVAAHAEQLKEAAESQTPPASGSPAPQRAEEAAADA